MDRKLFGNTGLLISTLGFGGFHLCETPYAMAEKLLNKYLDLGGNYIETAPSYGNGESEVKIGRAVSHRRDEFILASKVHDRDYEGCKASIESSLVNLQTDRIDLLLMHAVGTSEVLDEILSENGAIKAAEEALRDGKVNFIGISMHGQPDSLIEAINRYPFDAVMTTVNYFDDCNFPEIQQQLIPLANEKGIAIILMKPIGDGYLYKSVKDSFNYALNQKVSVVVTGMNTMEMLETDIDIANNYPELSEAEIEEILKNAPELNNYVCRQCGQCMPCPENVDITENFRLEGVFDRQMGDGVVDNAAEYALKERLKHWFGTMDRAINEYTKLDGKASNCTECGICMSKCPYNIDIIKKLKNVDYKLAPEYGKIFDN
jgi:predicted aldo/keto reductase-like oxidoreductase